ncbi:MAG: Hint domain-containing protein [Paracoccaceae bacterium]
MAVINTGLGGPRGVGEGSFRGTTLNTANGGSGNYDDGSLRVNITSVFGPTGINFFGTNYTSIYINTNGLITFAGPQASYTPTNLATTTQPAIAAFWSDVNITSGTATGTNNIYWDLDPVTHRVTITWLGVRAYQNPNTQGTNTFQIVLEHTSNGNFEIDFIYQQIQWTNGYTGIAQTGMTDGGANDYILPGSGNAASLLAYPTATLDPNDPTGVWSTRFIGTRPVCFGAGTMIDTPQGPRAVQDLRSGDLVSTLDDGPQPVRWAGGGRAVAYGSALPIRIKAGVLGNPRDLCVSAPHLVMLDGVDCELLFGEPEVLVAAKDLLGLAGVHQETETREVGYYHLLLDRHQIVLADGVPAESLLLGKMALEGLPESAHAELAAVFLPYELARLEQQPAARRVLKSHEARVLIASRSRVALPQRGAAGVELRAA